MGIKTLLENMQNFLGLKYDSGIMKQLKLSASSLEEFRTCRRCFYLKRKFKIEAPNKGSFALSGAVDILLKREFDIYRSRQERHPLCIENEIDAVPFKHDDIDKWRKSQKALEYKLSESIILSGKIDDIWVDVKTNKLIIVDYKTMAKPEDDFQQIKIDDRNKDQIAVYQWLLRKKLKRKKFSVSDRAYFVYCNAKKDEETFNKRLLFDIAIIPYDADDSWVEKECIEAYKCLQSSVIPSVSKSKNCKSCKYYDAVSKHITKYLSN